MGGMQITLEYCALSYPADCRVTMMRLHDIGSAWLVYQAISGAGFRTRSEKPVEHVAAAFAEPGEGRQIQLLGLAGELRDEVKRIGLALRVAGLFVALDRGNYDEPEIGDEILYCAYDRPIGVVLAVGEATRSMVSVDFGLPPIGVEPDRAAEETGKQEKKRGWF